MALKTQVSNGVDAMTKRKPISELRLQDPEIWDKVAWIRAHFVKDLDSGIRKMDFCNFVTQYLGRTGYRDVWHLLKIAYPHVDRVRKGRKYMYWGIRHSDKTIGQTESSLGSNKEIECNNNNNNNSQVDAMEGEAYFERCPSIKVKSEKMSDEDTVKSDNLLVMEFKEKDVFESFEDYEKSKENRLCSGKNGERSVTPPLEIFTEHQMTDSVELASKENASNNQPDKKDEASIESSLGFPSEPNESALTTNLLKPENINRVCIPLIQDVKKQRKNKGDDNTTEAKDETHKLSIDPVIVSVGSIGNQADQSNDKTTSDVQVVVVQDRGIQVCETSSSTNTIQRRKRNASQAKSTDCNVQPSSATTTVCSKQQPTSTNSRKKMKQSVSNNTSSAAVKAKVTSRQEDPANFIKVQKVPALPLMSRGYTASVTSSEQVSGHSIVVLKPPIKSSTATNSTTAKAASSAYIIPSLLNDRSYKTSGVGSIQTTSQLPKQYQNNSGNLEKPMKITDSHGSRLNPNTVRPIAERPDYNQLRNRELVRKLLEEHESQRNSKDYSSENDLQYTVDCLSAELEKERSMRLRLEIELRKVENQLDQERKLNEKLAALLMKR